MSTSAEVKQSKSLLQSAIIRVLSDKLSLIAFIIVILYFLVALLTSAGVLASGWNKVVGPSYMEPNATAFFGTDIFGQSVSQKVIKATESNGKYDCF